MPATSSVEGCVSHNHTCQAHIGAPDVAWSMISAHVVHASKKDKIDSMCIAERSALGARLCVTYKSMWHDTCARHATCLWHVLTVFFVKILFYLLTLEIWFYGIKSLFNYKNIFENIYFTQIKQLIINEYLNGLFERVRLKI